MRRPPLPHAAARSVVSAWLCAVLSIAHGADLHAALGLDAGGVRARAVLTDLRVADPGLAGDRFDLGVARLEGAASATLGWRRTAVAGPVGNLVVEGAVGIGLGAHGDSSAGGSGADRLRAGVELGARGVAGPVALAVRVSYGNRVPFAWPELGPDVGAAPPADPRARTGGDGEPVAAASASAAWRIDRAWTLTVAPSAARTASGWTGALDAALRRYAIGDDLDLSVRVDAATGSRARHAALGATLHHVPRRAPESRATLWIGVGEDGRAPGREGLALGGDVAWQVRAGASEAGVAAGWAPFFSDRPAGYAALQASTPMAAGRGRVAMAWTGTSWVATLGWSQALPR